MKRRNMAFRPRPFKRKRIKNARYGLQKARYEMYRFQTLEKWQ